MNYVGNFAHWIRPELMRHLETHNGDTRPIYQPDRWKTGNPILEEFNSKCEKAYSTSNHVFQQFNGNTVDIQGMNIQLPELPETRKHCHWWFIKLLPGQFQAMHVDPHLLEVENPVRYSMFLQDFIPGHIFVWDDKILTNYKKGDVYEWGDPMIVHGPANISFEPRYTLQITMYD
jgi:hypothetical protein